ncbi:hypothetical protein AB0D32_00780 [Micromonospora sp. NPDC048170]|uniref:hypothetical protein n=1 Tax=Micromonospora sp. NPDC048170 TaxID=3154819 RepID=UPI0033E55760
MTVLAVLSAGTLTWQSAALMAGLMAVWTAMGLLVEWQARRTLITLAQAVPAGLVTIRWDAPGRQVARLVWGAGSDHHGQQSRP